MSNSHGQINGKKNYPRQHKITILLFIIIFGGIFTADHYIPNSILSLPLIISTLASIIVTHLGIPKLKELKLKQIIRVEGPKKHQKKTGTPTMGGIFIVPTGLIIGNLIAINSEFADKIHSLSLLILTFMFIGCFDDLRSLTLNTNTGLGARGKLTLQAIAGIFFLTWAGSQEWIQTKIYLFNGLSIDTGNWIWPLALFVLIAESNATNLTDGLDGLASSCGALVFTGLGIQLMLRDNQEYLAIAQFSIVLAGSWMGFLIHNRNPAKVFMGDTGSLAMGAALSGIALLTNSLWALFVMGGIFFAESISVIFQVWVFKLTKRLTGKGHRVFRMAPLHHHYELAGNHEQLVVQNFWLITFGLVLLGLLLRSNY